MQKYTRNGRQLEFGIVTLVAILGALATIIVLHLFDVSKLSNLAIEAISSLHAPGFGLVSLTILIFARRHIQPALAYLLAFVGSSILGLAAETAQILGPRDAALSDLLQNLLGTASFLLIAGIIEFRPRMSGLRYVTAMGLGSLLALAAIVPSLYYGSGLLVRASTFPELVRYESVWRRQLLDPQSSSRLRIVDPPNSWSQDSGKVAIAIANDANRLLYRLEPYPDWDGYADLVFEASSGNNMPQSVLLVIRDTHDRRPFWTNVYTKRLELGQHATEFRVSIADVASAPEDGVLETSSIGNVFILADEKGGDESIIVGPMRLE